MIIIGVILVVAAAVLGIDVATANGEAVDVDAFGRTTSTNTGSLVVAGFVMALAASIGALLLVDGMRRRRSAAAEARQVREERERLVATLEEERTARENAEAATRAAMAQVTGSRMERDEKTRVDLRDQPSPPTLPVSSPPRERRVDA